MSRVGPNYRLVSNVRPVFNKSGEHVTNHVHQYALPLRHKGYQFVEGRLRPVLVTSPILAPNHA